MRIIAWRGVAAQPAGAAPDLRLHVREVAYEPDADVAHRELFTGSARSFWLDSSSVIDGFSRFSFMGDGSGPLAEYVTYSTTDGVVSITRPDGGTGGA